MGNGVVFKADVAGLNASLIKISHAVTFFKYFRYEGYQSSSKFRGYCVTVRLSNQPPSPGRQWGDAHPASKAALMYPLRSQFIIFRPRHKPFTQPLIHNKHHFGRDLRAKKSRLLRPRIFPLWKVLWHLRYLDTRGRLSMTGVKRLLLLLLMVMLKLELRMEMLLRLTRRCEPGGVGGGSSGEEQRIDTRPVVRSLRMSLRLGGIGTSRDRGREI